jgi:outer membrane immunogenic protein
LVAGPALFYVKGGWAWAHFEANTLSINTLNNAILNSVSGGETRNGWTVGGGVEYALAGSWSLKGEYNYLDFGTDRVTRSGATVTRFRDAETHVQVVKFGLNYRFGWGGTPVVARY